jgi:hypothetical protein
LYPFGLILKETGEPQSHNNIVPIVLTNPLA